MSRIITVGVAPNAFKGSLSALEAVSAIQAGLEQSSLACRIIPLPLADGGDGTLAVLLTHPGSRRVTVQVENALGQPIQADYGLLADGQTAILEMARASGLAQLGGQLDPLRASSFGTGQLMRHAIEQGATHLILGVGGSASTDGGAGALQALGVGLLDSQRQPIGRGGLALADLAHLIPNPQLDKISLEVLCDVDHLPLGPHGSAAVFGPQKGATPAQVTLLDAHLSHFFGLITAQGGRDVRQLAGAGAAGALAGGLAALAGAQLVPGAQTILHTLGYPDLIAQCDLVITGEGRLDEQTEHGKGPAVIAHFAAQRGIPVIALAGQIPDSALPTFQATFSLVPRPSNLAESQAHARLWLTQLAYQVGQTLAIGQGL